MSHAPAIACWRPALAGGLFLAMPFALFFDGEAHLSQAAWLGLGLAGGMFALVVANAGAALLLAWSTVHLLIIRHLASQGQLSLGFFLTANAAHARLVAGVAVLALAPVIFAGRPRLLLNMLRVAILVWAAWWLAEALGLDPLLTAHPVNDPYPEGLRGACLGSSVVLASMLGACWPLFLERRWWLGLLLIGPALIMQDSFTGLLAALAAGSAWGWAWLRAHGLRKWAARLAWLDGLALAAIVVVGIAGWRGGFAQEVRLALWLPALEHSELLGHGPGSWAPGMGSALGHASPYSGYVLALWEYGWIGLGVVLAGLGQLVWRARQRPRLLGAVVGVALASAGTLIWEQPVAAAWCLMLFGLVEVCRGS